MRWTPDMANRVAGQRCAACSQYDRHHGNELAERTRQLIGSDPELA
jgi:hypothetical protein